MQGVTLETIGGGALGELFATELSRVLANVSDPNTDTKTKRKIQIEVSFKPNRDRDVTDVEMKCSSKLAGIMTVETQLFLGKHQGKLIAVENDPRQSELFDTNAAPLAAVGGGVARGDFSKAEVK